MQITLNVFGKLLSAIAFVVDFFHNMFDKMISTINRRVLYDVKHEIISGVVWKLSSDAVNYYAITINKVYILNNNQKIILKFSTPLPVHVKIIGH